jgi:Holliday junction DNA helicase RuvA
MIASLTGTVQKIESNSLIIHIGGVGLRVYVPRTVLEDVGGAGRRITLYTHLQVREDDLSLFGFETEDDLNLFEVLLGVNGVGPKVALAILGSLSPELLKGAIMREDAVVLQRVPGIGKKTAERIMFHLRDKLDLGGATSTLALVSDVDADVIDILTGLGFSIIEAQSALQHVPREVSAMDDRVQAALQYLDQS